MAISFLDPRGESAVEPTPYDLSTHLAPGITVGLLANGFPDSVEFLDAVGEAITARRPGIELARWNKGDASAIANDAVLGEIEAECAAVVAAYGH
ncbi:MAG: hypothetical protein CL433_03630 [Acidimicrobiaceae bacterium]|jgi:hypothetical protein|nr:hypothetical protein [Acidimicrobiaceae bacterium]